MDGDWRKRGLITLCYYKLKWSLTQPQPRLIFSRRLSVFHVLDSQRTRMRCIKGKMIALKRHFVARVHWQRLPTAVLLLVFFLTVMTYFRGSLRINLTPSVPVGLYWCPPPLTPIDAVGVKARLVATCLPPVPSAMMLTRRYVAPGRCPYGTAPLLKRVVAAAGDHVLVSERGVWVNGRRLAGSRPIVRDQHGNPLPVALGTHRLDRGEVWLFANNVANSIDSRTYGPVPDTLIQRRAYPLLVRTPNDPGEEERRYHGRVPGGRDAPVSSGPTP